MNFDANHPGRGRAGFSLIELLVVTAIIATLISVLLPSLAAARATARAVVCQSNLHQVGVATHLYLDASNEWFWRYYTDQPGGRLWWFGYEPGGPGTGANRPLDLTRGVLGQNLDNPQRLQCPDFNYNDPQFFHKFDRPSASYGFNLKLGPSSPLVPPARRCDYLRRLGSVMAFVDGIHFDTSPGYNEGHYVAYTANAATASGYAHFRHDGRAQFLTLDGHVDTQPLTGRAYRTIGGGPAANLTAPDGTNAIYGY